MDERNINALASEVRVFLEGLDQNQVSQRLLHEAGRALYKELYPVIDEWTKDYPDINRYLKANLFVTMCECCRAYDPVIVPSFLALFTVASHADLSNILQRKGISFMELVNADDQEQALEALKIVYGFSNAAVKEKRVKEAVKTWPERKKALGY